MTILEILDRKIIPWSQECGLHRLVVADDSLASQTLPDGMIITKTKLSGRRVAVKGPRDHGNMGNTVANWPDDGMKETRTPFILCVVSGEARLQIRDLIVHCAEGHFILIPPRVAFSSGDRERALRTGQVPDLMSFHTWDNHLQCGLGYAIGTNLFIPNPVSIQLLDLLIEETLSGRGKSDEIGNHIFLAFLTMLRRDLSEGHYFGHALAALDAPAQSDRIDPIARIQRHVKTNLSTPLTTDRAATMALMSRSQFIKRFRMATGQSFTEYVTQCRVEEVKMLLRETDWTIVTIHKFVGFKDATRLRRIFRQHVGVSLSEYRVRSRSAVAGETEPKLSAPRRK